jgi:hypothetical protein
MLTGGVAWLAESVAFPLLPPVELAAPVASALFGFCVVLVPEELGCCVLELAVVADVVVVVVVVLWTLCADPDPAPVAGCSSELQAAAAVRQAGREKANNLDLNPFIPHLTP